MRAERAALGETRSDWRFAGLVIAIAVALKLAYALEVELWPEETYYWMYSRHLDWGYLDHPPMVAWLIRLGTSLFGESALGVRAGALACGALASLFVYLLTRDLYGLASARLALVLMQALPFFFAAGLMMTPDAPLTAAWAATLWALVRALVRKHAGAWWGAGIALGLGLLSKYTIALLGVAALLFVLFDREGRAWLKRPEPYGATLLALVVFSPVILWNLAHHWASFSFQTSRRLAEARRFSLHKLVGSVIVLLTPVGVAVLVPLFARLHSTERGDTARGARLLALAAAVPLGVFVVFSLFHEVKLDWTGAPWVAAVPLMAAGLSGSDARFERFGRALRPWALLTLLILVGGYALGYRYLTVGIDRLGYGTHPDLVPVGWRALGTQVEQLTRQMPAQPLVVGLDRYPLASELTFYWPVRNRPPITSGYLCGGLGVMYEQWYPAEAQRGRDLLLIAWRREELDTAAVRACAARLGPIGEGSLRRPGGAAIRSFYYRAAFDYRPIADRLGQAAPLVDRTAVAVAGPRRVVKCAHGFCDASRG